MGKYEGMFIKLGPPGTGKTTWLARQVRAVVDDLGMDCGSDGAVRSPVMVCSLTRTAAAEAAGRDMPIPRDAVGTLHSFAFRAVGRPNIAEALLEDWNKRHRDFQQTAGRVDVDEPAWDFKMDMDAFRGDEAAMAYNLLRTRMVPREAWPATVRDYAAKWEEFKAETDSLDFTDLIEDAYKFIDTAPGGPQVIIADETQDHSALEFGLLKKWGRTAGCLMVTGDPWQALYVWRGAHPEIFVDPDVPESHRSILKQSYRVPRAVHAYAMRWIRNLTTYRPIEYLPRDADGAVEFCGADWTEPAEALRLAEADLARGKKVMIAASCAYLLSPMITLLRRAGLPFSNPWRTRRGDWNPLHRGRGVSMADRVSAFLAEDPASDARRWTMGDVRAWASVLTAKGLLIRGGKTRLASAAPDAPATDAALSVIFASGIVDTLRGMFADRAFGEDVPLSAVLEWWLSRVLASMRPRAEYPVRVAAMRGATALREATGWGVRPAGIGQLFVGTIHSYKGGEADTVILFPDLSPAGMREWDAGDRALRDGPIRLFYVGITRARERLIICRARSARSVPLDDGI